MEVANKNNYFNSIFRARVVNIDRSQDPQGYNRVQIYVPSIHYRYDDIVEGYVNNTNRGDHMSKFPWAFCLPLKVNCGSWVYAAYLDNELNKFVILGLDTGDSTNSDIITAFEKSLDHAIECDCGCKDEFDSSFSDGYGGFATDLVEMTIPIILYNEVGVPFGSYPNNIGDNYFSKIVSSDAGQGWSIGLLQWHHTRAFDICYEIAKSDPTWESYFSDKSLQLYIDLKNCVNKGSSSPERSKYQDTYRPTEGSATFNGIQALLSSGNGKKVQIDGVRHDVTSYVEIVQSKGITNPALIIFLADIVNQYGAGISSWGKAKEINNNLKGTMEQLDEFRAYWASASNGQYANRRDTTYSYIKNLYDQGKFNTNNNDDVIINGNGIYCLPFAGSYGITFPYAAIYSNGNKHRGIDFGCPLGTPLVSPANGTIKSFDNFEGYTGYGADYTYYGNFCVIHTDDGKVILLCHMTNTLGKNGRISKGDPIGISGNTGNSSGPHLHFELRTSSTYGTDIDPAPYLGI